MFKESATLDFHYNKIDEAALAFFRSIVGDEFVLITGENYEKYAKDETENLRFYPEAVVFGLATASG